MALSIENININVKYGLDASHDVSQAASDLYSAYEEGIEIAEDLRGYWTGDNATRYIALLEERLEKLRERSSALYKVGGAIRETTLLYEQEQKDLHYKEQREHEEAAEKRRQAKSKKK